jgi:hypothetical protein
MDEVHYHVAARARRTLLTFEEIAERTGATDIFVLRKVASDRLFNTGGHGRGAGWAGNVSIEPSHEPLVARALEEGLIRRRSGVPFRIFGPYWGSEVAAVEVEDDLIVFGGTGVSERDDTELAEAAAQAAASAHDVATEKVAADEAEVQQALKALTGVEPGPLGAMARHVASVTAQSLSCEFGAVLLTGPPARIFTTDEGWHPAAPEEDIIAALLPLLQVARDGIYVEQDLSESSFPFRPLSFDDGLVARCVVPLGPDARLGLLVAAHAGSSPRGFTTLCQRVARTMGEAGEPLLTAALDEG